MAHPTRAPRLTRSIAPKQERRQRQRLGLGLGLGLGLTLGLSGLGLGLMLGLRLAERFHGSPGQNCVLAENR